MANIKSAKKRIKVNATKAARNKSVRTSVKTAVKKVAVAVEANDKDAAQAALLVANKTIAAAQSKGIFHKSTASRKISRLTVQVNKM